MGHRKIKYLNGLEYNRILFYVDRVGDPLPPTGNVSVGSEVRVIESGAQYILNTQKVWQLQPST